MGRLNHEGHEGHEENGAGALGRKLQGGGVSAPATNMMPQLHEAGCGDPALQPIPVYRPAPFTLVRTRSRDSFEVM